MATMHLMSSLMRRKMVVKGYQWLNFRPLGHGRVIWHSVYPLCLHHKPDLFFVPDDSGNSILS
jgi:hypothetical protein